MKGEDRMKGAEEETRVWSRRYSRRDVLKGFGAAGIGATVGSNMLGLSGVLLAAQLSSGQPTVGQGWELDVISEVVVGGTLLTGGTGTMSGSLAGVFLLNILQNLINQVGTLGSYGQQLVSGGFLIAVVVIQAYLTRKERL